MDKILIKESLILLNFIGSNPIKNDLFAKIRAFISQGCLIILIVQLFLYCITRIHNYEEVFQNFVIAVAAQQAVSKLLVVVFKRNHLVDVITIVETQFWPMDKYGQELHSQINNALKIVRKIIYTMIVTMALSGCTFWSGSLLRSSRMLPLPLYSAADVGNLSSLSYIAWFIFEVTCFTIIGVPAFGGVDILLIVIAAYNSFELKLVYQGIIELGGDDSAESTKEDMEKFKELAKHHELILRCLRKLNAIFSTSFLNLVVTTAIVLCLCLLGLIYSIQPLNVANCIKFLALFCISTGFLFIYCALGTIIENQTETISEAIYNCGWYRKNKIPLRKSLAFALHQSQQKVKLNGGGVIDLNLENFTTVMKISFNFFTVLRVALSKNLTSDNALASN